MSQEQVSAGKTACTFIAGEGLFFCVGTFVPLQMLKASEGSCAGRADVWPGLVRLWGREVWIDILNATERLCVHSTWYEELALQCISLSATDWERTRLQSNLSADVILDGHGAAGRARITDYLSHSAARALQCI